MNDIQPYITKKDYIYNILKCNPKVFIPTNDFDVWNNSEKYIAWLWVYDKLQLALSQNINCGPLGTFPKEFPIVVKPITNLYGMGKHAQKVDTLQEYKRINYEKSGLFWMPYIEGKNYKIDLILQNGKIVWHSIFEGHLNDTNNLGTFSHFSLCTKSIPDFITKWVSDTFLKQEYTGCINLEYIGKTIIECHLRMGDINHIDMYYYLMCKNKVKLFPSIIELYKNGIWNLPKKFSLPKKVYLVPIYIPKSEYNLFKNNITRDNVYHIANSINTKKAIFMLQKDPPPEEGNNPNGWVRICNISSVNLSVAMKVKNEILKFLGNNVAFYKKIANRVGGVISNKIEKTSLYIPIICVLFVIYLCITSTTSQPNSQISPTFRSSIITNT